ncbi:hypothetical protein NC651_030667 [Populus alba x Populus x berolinensis]|nr:hypothetical protein NC651_030667 [Populus alba x Populus x berolinensis]
MDAVTSTNLSSSSTPLSSNESGLNLLSAAPCCRSSVDATRSSNQQGKALLIPNWLWLNRSHEKRQVFVSCNKKRVKYYLESHIEEKQEGT